MDLHPPAGGIHSWRDFFVHMATIVLGIMIAIGLEQSVEWVHHRQQRKELQVDLSGDVRSVLDADAVDIRRGGDMRDYLTRLRDAVNAQREGRPAVSVGKLGDTNLLHPRMAAWDAAKESGVVTLLPAGQIRLYDHFLFQLSQLDFTIVEFHDSSFALQSFEQRFLDTPGGFDYRRRPVTPELSRMSPEELEEYSKLLSAEIASVDRMLVGIRFVDAEARALNDGAKTEQELVERAMKVANVR